MEHVARDSHLSANVRGGSFIYTFAEKYIFFASRIFLPDFTPFSNIIWCHRASKLLSKPNQKSDKFPIWDKPFTTLLHLGGQIEIDPRSNHLKYSHDLEIQFAMLYERNYIDSEQGLSHKN